MTTLFVSDLHLEASRPEITDAFVRFLQTWSGRADALYILGDLFEVWFGDDDPDPSHRRVSAALSEFASAGAPVFLTHGNRDFLIGRRYARESNLQLLDEQTTIEIGGDRVLLLHGDELCTDDPAYQRFRRIVRNRAVGRVFLLLPLSVRRKIADRLRESSTRTIKPDAITDVNTATVASTMREADVRIMIHGHTHRPAIHQMQLDGEPALRIVLGDWYTQGSVLHWTEHGPELKTLALDPA
ncbi:MAG: UDP-2,3-diacylglucosamine diphosphatase [Gammaproteobacteria bacterium]